MEGTKRSRAPEGIVRATGKNRQEWFAVLDEWGAAGRAYREIASWLTGEHGLSAWWAQKLIVEYEQARGIRGQGARPDGTFAAGASKTVGVPLDRLWAALTDADQRSRWLPDLALTERTSQPERSIRFDVGDGTRLAVTVAAMTAGKAQLAVEHDRLPDAEAAAAARTAWKKRLGTLKALLEDPD